MWLGLQEEVHPRRGRSGGGAKERREGAQHGEVSLSLRPLLLFSLPSLPSPCSHLSIDSPGSKSLERLALEPRPPSHKEEREKGRGWKVDEGRQGEVTEDESDRRTTGAPLSAALRRVSSIEIDHGRGGHHLER